MLDGSHLTEGSVVTEKTPWLCPHCDIPLRILEIQPGEQIVPCPECHEPIQIISAGRQIREIRPVKPVTVVDQPATVAHATAFSSVAKRISRFLSHPRAVSLTATTMLGVSLIALWLANLPTKESAKPPVDPSLAPPANADSNTGPDEQVNQQLDEGSGASNPSIELALSAPAHVQANLDENSSENHERDTALDPAPVLDADSPPTSLNRVVAKLESIGQFVTEFNRQRSDELEVQEKQSHDGPTISSSVNSVSSSNPPAVKPTALEEPASNVDVHKALEFRIARWEQSRPVPFGELLVQLEELAGGRIQIADADSLAMQTRMKQPVSFHYKQKTLAVILADVLQKVDLRYEVRDNTIHLLPATAEK